MRRRASFPSWSIAIWSSSRKLVITNADVKLLILTLLVASISIAAIKGQTKPRTGEDSESTPGKFRVCIDPGHPSENNDGGELTNGLREVTVNWEVALLLRRELESDGFTVVMTKESESEFVTNKDRAEIANRAQADLLLRLHADAGKATGFTVYYPRKQGTVRGVTGPARGRSPKHRNRPPRPFIRLLPRNSAASLRTMDCAAMKRHSSAENKAPLPARSSVKCRPSWLRWSSLPHRRMRNGSNNHRTKS